MPGSKVPLVIMTGASERSEVERMMSLALQAITLDTIERALSVEAIGPIVLATNSASLAESVGGKPVRVELETSGEEFHFGRRLQELITEQGMERVFYIGGGSSALLSSEEMGRIAETLLPADEAASLTGATSSCTQSGVIANNFYSTDFAAFAPAQAINSIEPSTLTLDNDLAWRLVKRAGLPCKELPRNAATQLDVDTPTDLMTLKLHPGVGPHTRRCLDSLEIDTSHVEQALGFFTDRTAEVLVAGRVSASTWAYLEYETACRVRLFSEERGMRASGRQAQGEALSLLGFYLEEVGLQRFFATLAEMSQAVFLDSRVLFAHRRIWPSAADRFYSDLRQPEKINDPWVRRFTQAAIEAPIPVVLGGHSLVAGGLYALVEAAWARGEDLARHVEKLEVRG
jgi:hypothetical protein